MAIPIDKTLYEKVKKMADSIYDKPSAYKSGYIVRMYKRMGGQYEGTPGGLKRWFSEDWRDISKDSYPVLRPTKRVSGDTPLTVKEIDPVNLKKQIALKQRIRGKTNLPPFLPKKSII